MTRRDNSTIWLPQPRVFLFSGEICRDGYHLGVERGETTIGPASVFGEPIEIEAAEMPHRAFMDCQDADDFLAFTNRFGAVMGEKLASQSVKRLEDLRRLLASLQNAIDRPLPSLPTKSRRFKDAIWHKRMDISLFFTGCEVRAAVHALAEPGEVGMRLAHEPLRLWDFMCLTAFTESQGQAWSKRCSECGSWMWVGPNGEFIASKDTCSDACRRAKSRRLKKESGHE